MFKKILIIFFSLFFFPIAAAENIFLSLKKNKVNVRYGPSFEFPIKYVYKKIDFPIKQIDKKENFRRIIDIKNNSGWIHISQLKKSNSLIVLKDTVAFKKNTKFSKPVVKLEKGRLVLIKKCVSNWCKIKSEKFNGWIELKNVWGSTN